GMQGHLIWMLSDADLANDTKLGWVDHKYLPAGPVGNEKLMSARPEHDVVGPAADGDLLGRIVLQIVNRQLAGIDEQRIEKALRFVEEKAARKRLGRLWIFGVHFLRPWLFLGFRLGPACGG